jgi:hypothetical protein
MSRQGLCLRVDDVNGVQEETGRPDALHLGVRPPRQHLVLSQDGLGDADGDPAKGLFEVVLQGDEGLYEERVDDEIGRASEVG